MGVRGLVALACAALLAAACSGGEPSASARREPSPAAAGSKPEVCPLTGRKPPRGVDPSRPAVAVKVENSPAARPQHGLERAEVVYEEIVEGGITRFMAIYHCTDAAKVGPVRSARFDDPKIVLPFGRALAYSGANGIVERELQRSGIVSLTELNAGDALFRDPPGSTDVHTLFADVPALRRLAARREARKPPNPSFLRFGPLPEGARRGRSVTVQFNPSVEVTWRWRGGRYVRFEDGQPFTSADGGQISATNVLVQEVRVDRSRTLVDSAGYPSPDIALHGGGRAFLLRGGKVIAGTWRARRGGRVTVFRTRSGEPFRFERGITWVELVPSRKGEVKGRVILAR